MRPPFFNAAWHLSARGFTLVEMVIALTLLSLLATVAIPMLRMPMTAYMEASARARVTTNLDWVQSKLTADFSTALPNSVRVRNVGNRYFIEFLQVHAQGRYLAGNPLVAVPACPLTPSCTATPDELAFSTSAACTDTCFMSLGDVTPVGNAAVVNGSDFVVVSPTNTTGLTGDPYANAALPAVQSIKSRLVSLAAWNATRRGRQITMAPNTFPNIPAPGESPRIKRFYMIASSPVTYACDITSGTLTRYSGYNILPVQPVAFGGGVQAVPLATNIACNITSVASTLEPTGMRGRGGLVTIKMTLSAPVPAGGIPEQAELIFSVGANDG